MIELLGVRKSLGGREILQPTDLGIAAGRTTVLLGPSGCGKSTLLRLILGLLWPDAGTVLFDGQPLAPEAILAVRRRMGYVVQDGGLFPHLTAGENAALVARHLGWPPNRIATRLRELAALARLPQEFLSRYPAQLSGGQRQRVGLMRALMLDPAVLLLDEPLGALDPLVRAELQADLRDAFRELARTVVLVTHDLAEAAFFANEVVLLRDGRIVQRGRPADLVRNPAEPFVTQFIQAQRPAQFLAGADV
ncbi:MAG TPA: ATP-binding cassette domain-containing protein [Gemmataceae bacterium]|nr:ATP-binding cassette domain-containing protein [Gemmataceae bacterium]